jgi:hypothetical protein
VKAVLAEYRARTLRSAARFHDGGRTDPDILAGCRKIGIYGNISKDALQADVPTQQPTKFQLVINLKAAADAARAPWGDE